MNVQKSLGNFLVCLNMMLVLCLRVVVDLNTIKSKTCWHKKRTPVDQSCFTARVCFYEVLKEDQGLHFAHVQGLKSADSLATSGEGFQPD